MTGGLLVPRSGLPMLRDADGKLVTVDDYVATEDDEHMADRLESAVDAIIEYLAQINAWLEGATS